MKNFLITQNVSYNSKRGYSFSLSKNWFDYSLKIGINLIPYNYIFSSKNLNNLRIDGVIFSGGNDLYHLKKKKENYFRDIEEGKLLKYFLKKNKPILGICRGFQFIAHKLGGNIIKTKNHVKKKQKIYLVKKNFFKEKILYVNSYHNFSINFLPKNFEVIAKHKDDSVEIAKYNKIYCLMFHPERKNHSQKKIDLYFKKIFNIA